ncbi:MAG: DUF1284 domain-containing protein [Chloroflexi bacterium]|nr:DUF1284 domain-containing protein [Chloroflexota bacterium]
MFDSDTVRLRPHHLLCSRGFRGYGYGDAFVERFASVLAALRRPGVTVAVVEGADDICAACPHCGGGSCDKSDGTPGFDLAAAALLGVEPGGEHSWPDLVKLLESITPEDIRRTCAGCGWLPYGYCTEAYDIDTPNT